MVNADITGAVFDGMEMEEDAEGRRQDRRRRAKREEDTDARNKVLQGRQDMLWQRQLDLMTNQDKEAAYKDKLEGALRQFAATDGELTEPLRQFYNENVPDGMSVESITRDPKTKLYTTTMVGPDGKRRKISDMSKEDVGREAMGLADPVSYFRSLHSDPKSRDKAATIDKMRPGEVYSSFHRTHVKVAVLEREYEKDLKTWNAQVEQLKNTDPAAAKKASDQGFPTQVDWLRDKHGIGEASPDTAVAEGPKGKPKLGAAGAGGEATPDGSVYQAMNAVGNLETLRAHLKARGLPEEDADLKAREMMEDPSSLQAFVREEWGSDLKPEDLQRVMGAAGKGSMGGGQATPPAVPKPGEEKPAAGATAIPEEEPDTEALVDAEDTPRKVEAVPVAPNARERLSSSGEAVASNVRKNTKAVTDLADDVSTHFEKRRIKALVAAVKKGKPLTKEQRKYLASASERALRESGLSEATIAKLKSKKAS